MNKEMPGPTPSSQISTFLAKALDMAVVTRLSAVQVTKPARVDLTPADPAAFWSASSVADPRPVRVAAEWEPFDGPEWRALELVADSEGPGTHRGSREMLATAHVRRRSRDAAAPLIVMVHGFAIPFTGFDRWLAWKMRRRGASTVRVDLPYHLRRSVPGRASGDGFFSIDPPHTRLVVRQAVEEVASLVAWARAEVTPYVCVIGVSLGGLIATLCAALLDLDRVIAIAPLCDPPASFSMRPPGALQRRMGMLGDGEGYWGRNRAAAKAALEGALAPLTARLLRPVTPGNRVTLVRADHDLIVGPGPVDELASAWGTELWTYPHGHITVMSARGVGQRIIDRAVDVGAARGDLQLAG